MFTIPAEGRQQRAVIRLDRATEGCKRDAKPACSDQELNASGLRGLLVHPGVLGNRPDFGLWSHRQDGQTKDLN